MERHLARPRGAAPREAVPNLAVRLQDMVIHDNRKLFGEAEVRLDALVVHGGGAGQSPTDFYAPQTFRFPRVADGDKLPIGESGLLVFYGRPRYFLDLFVLLSRNRKDSDDLASLLSKQLGSPQLTGAVGTLLGLAVAAPHVAVVTAAMGAAAVVGDFSYQLLSHATGSTIGLYRASWLEHRDGFGAGRHPEAGAYREKGLSFWYEVVPDVQPGQ